MSFYPSAEIICDSVNANTGDRITTFVLTYHRFIHSEFMTYRMFSRNASSSRAIPVQKMIEKVQTLKVEPIHWGKNQKGMQARQELSLEEIQQARIVWNIARNEAVKCAEELVKIGAHKQIVNRILEPFSPITVVCTATDYQNFFDQRCHPDAQPDIKYLADEMKKVYNASKPDYLKPGGFHLPFIEKDLINQLDFENTRKLIEIATGRCARVSYLNHNGVRDVKADIDLHDRLISAKPAHLSPFEHCAMASISGNRFANLKGFVSYRYLLENKLSKTFKF